MPVERRPHNHNLGTQSRICVVLSFTLSFFVDSFILSGVVANRMDGVFL